MGLRRRALENEKWSGEFDVHLCELDSLVNMDDGSLGSGPENVLSLEDQW